MSWGGAEPRRDHAMHFLLESSVAAVLHLRSQSQTFALIGFSMAACLDAPPCTESGAATLAIAEARVPTIRSIATDGEATCRVEVPPDCGPGRCFDTEHGERMRVANVYAARRGQCRVTIEFTDGCQPTTLTFRFGGAMENCCEDVCARLPSGQVPAVCTDP